MPLVNSGTISLAGSTLGRSVEYELSPYYGSGPSSTISLNDTYVRILASKSSGTITLANCYGGCVIYSDPTYVGTPGYYPLGSYPTGSISGPGYTPYMGTDTNRYIQAWWQGGSTAALQIYSASGDPGQSYFTYAQVGTAGVLYSSSASYYWSGSYGQWLWFGTSWGFSSSTPETIGARII